MNKLLEQGREEQKKSKFKLTREILYGSLYKDSNVFLKGYYNANTYYSLKYAQVQEYMASLGRSFSKTAARAKDWYNKSAFGAAVKTSSKKVASAAVAVKNVTVKAARTVVLEPAKKAYAKTSSLMKNAAKKTGAFFKTSGAWIRGRFSREKESKQAASHEDTPKDVEKKRSRFGVVFSQAKNFVKRGASAVASAAVGAKKAIVDNKAVKKVRSTVSFLKRKALEIKGTYEARSADSKYESDRKKAIENNQIREMLRQKKGGLEYTEKLNRFRAQLQNDKAVSSNLNLRANLERLRRNAGAMEKGNTGDVELAEMSSDGSFKKDDPGMGMLQSLNELDLGSALIKEDEGTVKSVPESNTVVGKSADLTKKLSESAKKIKNIGQTGVKVVKQIEKGQETIKKGLSKLGAAKKVEGKIDIPVGNLEKAFNNIINIADDKQRTKNMANFLTNALDQAGKIVKQVGGDNSFSRIANQANVQVSGMEQAGPDADAVKQAQASVKNIMNATKILSTTMKEAKQSHKLLDQAVILGPVLTIIKGVDTFNTLQKTNDKLKALTEEDKALNITDKNVIRHMGLGKNMMLKENETKQKTAMANAVFDASVSTASILTGGSPVVAQITKYIKKVSPIDHLINQMKAKTDHEIMMEDAFGSMEKYEKIKAEHGLTRDEIENEILKMTESSTVQEYADRVRAETALHLHSRSEQARKNAIENAATKLRDAGNIEGKTAEDIYKEIGGRTDYDKLMGRSKEEIHKMKVEEAKQKRLEERKKKEQSLQSGKNRKAGKAVM